MSKHPARTPTVTPAFDPNDERYWDPRDLEQELLRTFQVCHECRMCVTYCGSFPILFKNIDREIDAGRAEGSERVDAETVHAVSDHCWQCKLCYIKCPYTPDEGAHERLDFPRLMAREKAQRSRRDGVPIVDQVLGEPQRIGARITAEKAVLHELETYNELVPAADELSATIFIEYPERDLREHMLVALAGVETAFYVRVAGERLPVTPDLRGTEPGRTMAVQYVKFALSEAARGALRAGNLELSLGVEHEAYRAEVVLSQTTAQSLRDDVD